MCCYQGQSIRGIVKFGRWIKSAVESEETAGPTRVWGCKGVIDRHGRQRKYELFHALCNVKDGSDQPCGCASEQFMMFSLSSFSPDDDDTRK